MKLRVGLVLAFGLVVVASPVVASEAQLLVQSVSARNGGVIDVGSFAVPQGKFSRVNAADGENASPDVYWTGGPEGTRTYVVAMERVDPRANGAPDLLWGVCNVPVAVTQLEQDLGESPPTSLRPILNVKGGTDYLGPAPQVGPSVAYHIEVFALDAALPTEPPLTRASLAEAMRGHVLASGEMVATYTGGS